MPKQKQLVIHRHEKGEGKDRGEFSGTPGNIPRMSGAKRKDVVGSTGGLRTRADIRVTLKGNSGKAKETSLKTSRKPSHSSGTRTKDGNLRTESPVRGNRPKAA